MSANDVTNKSLISKIYKQLIQVNIKKKQKPKQTNKKKTGRRPEQTFFQRRHTGWQEEHEKMFNITNY